MRAYILTCDRDCVGDRHDGARALESHVRRARREASQARAPTELANGHGHPEGFERCIVITTGTARQDLVQVGTGAVKTRLLG